MYYQQDLRAKLQQRRNRLYKSSHLVYNKEIVFFVQFLKSVPYFVGILEDLDRSCLEITFEDWRKTGLGWQNLDFPGSEIAKAKVCYGCMCYCAEGQAEAWQIAADFCSGNLDEHVRFFTEIFVDPLVNFLHDRLDEGGSMLYLLEQYKHKTEWFHREALFAQYQGDTSRGEVYLDAYLREFLVDQGIEYPFSTPSSPSGRTDIVAGLHTSEPLVLEVKLFEPSKGYDRAYVRKGLSQVYKYASDYNKTVGYLVIYNLSDYDLVFQTAQNDGKWPPRLQIGNSTFFIVPIDVHPIGQTASHLKKVKQYMISEEYLLCNDEGDHTVEQ